MRRKHIQAQEAQTVPKNKNPKRSTPRYITIEIAKHKNKERTLKVATVEKYVIYKRTPIRLSADCSADILQARRKWHNIFKVLKKKNFQLRILGKVII